MPLQNWLGVPNLDQASLSSSPKTDTHETSHHPVSPCSLSYLPALTVWPTILWPSFPGKGSNDFWLSVCYDLPHSLLMPQTVSSDLECVLDSIPLLPLNCLHSHSWLTFPRRVPCRWHTCHSSLAHYISIFKTITPGEFSVPTHKPNKKDCGTPWHCDISQEIHHLGVQ